MPIAPEVYKKIVTAKVYIDDNFQNFGELLRHAQNFVKASFLAFPRSFPSLRL